MKSAALEIFKREQGNVETNITNSLRFSRELFIWLSGSQWTARVEDMHDVLVQWPKIKNIFVYGLSDSRSKLYFGRKTLSSVLLV